MVQIVERKIKVTETLVGAGMNAWEKKIIWVIGTILAVGLASVAAWWIFWR